MYVSCVLPTVHIDSYFVGRILDSVKTATALEVGRKSDISYRRGLMRVFLSRLSLTR